MGIGLIAIKDMSILLQGHEPCSFFVEEIGKTGGGPVSFQQIFEILVPEHLLRAGIMYPSFKIIAFSIKLVGTTKFNNSPVIIPGFQQQLTQPVMPSSHLGNTQITEVGSYIFLGLTYAVGGSLHFKT